MRKMHLILFLLCFSLSGLAQHQQKWKAPKRPKRPKWEAPKQLAPEVIDVWRPYNVADNWFLDFNGGASFSLAENTGGHRFGNILTPLFDFGVGKQFSNAWSTRLNFGYRKQKGWASKEAMSNSTMLGDGDYTYQLAVAYIDEELSLIRMFCHYNELRRFDAQVFAGAGLNYSWGFAKKTNNWDRYGYPIDNTDHLNLAARAGVHLLYKVADAADLSLQGTFNLVGDNFNGVRNGSSVNSYVDVALGVRIHLMDHYGNCRYYKVRRWEATAMRASTQKVAELLDEEKRKEYEKREASEVVAFGELMKTRISFYINRTFVNDAQMENVRIVADFLQKHPEVNLLVRGYSGASTNSESPNMHLAEKRAEAVKRALIRHYGVDPERFDTWYDEDESAPFPMKGEWIDGVVFMMIHR